MNPTPPHALINALVDDDSWRSWDTPVPDVAGSPEYREALAAARESADSDESVVTGSARVGDHPVAVVAGDFSFLAGSVGIASAQRIVAAFERATALGLPVMGMPVSGGTRMQEGTPAFLLMAAIAASVQRHNESGLPYLVYLRNPTTGGVLASWGSLGDITFAQPGALVGFVGPRVYEGMFGEPFPPDAQTGEGLAAAGVIDGVCDASGFRQVAVDALAAWRSSEPQPRVAAWESTGTLPRITTGAEPSSRLNMPGADVTGWQAVQATRDPARPGFAELLDTFDAAVELRGTGTGEIAVATRLVLGVLDGIGCLVIGQDRAIQATGAAVGPADLRVARRGLALAQRWGLPVVTVVDTQGGELSPTAEQGALAGEIARCLATLSDLSTPTVALLLGAGAGGAALALLPCDRVVAVADGWVTPLPPEGAALIRYRSLERTAEVADAMEITAHNLYEAGAVDRVIDPPTADMAAVAAALAEELARVASAPVDLGARAGKWSATPERRPR